MWSNDTHRTDTRLAKLYKTCMVPTTKESENMKREKQISDAIIKLENQIDEWLKEERDYDNAPAIVHEINERRYKKQALQWVLNNDDSASP